MTGITPIVPYLPPELQADATLTQANPVSGTKYTVLATIANTVILSIATAVVWTVQPSPLEAHLTIDGNTLTHSKANPATGAYYYAHHTPSATETLQLMDGSYDVAMRIFKTHEGRSVKVEAETTGGTTSSLVCRVRHGKW